MKMKKVSKREKHQNDKESLKQQQFNKKLKLENGKTKNDELTTVSNAAVQMPVKTIDTNIFNYFRELSNGEEKTRTEAALRLFQQIHGTNDPEKRQKELIYTLKRLIRGCGASTNVSRAGFFTGLVGFLKSFSSQEINLEQVFDNLNKELHVGSAIANKEDSDAVVGKILICGALLHSGRLTEANNEHLERVANILLQSTSCRTYHSSLGFYFLCEFISTLSESQFESCVWPLLQKELVKPWSKQSLQSVHCLISIQKQFPHIVNSKFLKNNFGGSQLLNPESFQHLYKIFWEHSNTYIITHPAFECFGSYIAKSKYLVKFWCDTVEPRLKNPTKVMELETLKILTDILDNINAEQTNVHELLTSNFMRMFIEGLQTCKRKENDTLRDFYNDFLESLIKCCGKLTRDDVKVALIKRLIFPPGNINIEQFTGHRIIHQLINTLGENGVKDVFQLYKSIFLGMVPKNAENLTENWLNVERFNAGYICQKLLQHKSVQSSYQWRGEELKLLFSYGLFYVTDSGEICKKEEAGKLSKNFAEKCKIIFYTCLQSNLSNIQNEETFLYNLAEYCQENIFEKHAVNYLRIQKLSDSVKKSWKRMFDHVSQSIKSNAQDKECKKQIIVDTSSKSESTVETVFNILLLNMGLQLFREPEMADPAIDDLLKCIQRVTQKTKSKKDSKEANDHDDEPEWIEVVVDLFLHLLSQNNNAMRNIVNTLFPHLCDNLSLSAVHQILSMLDMKDGKNPLSTKNEDEEEENNDLDEEIEFSEDSADTENGTDSESDNDDAEDEDNETVTENDKLRNAISQALIKNGSANIADDDMESINLDDLTEEEGRKLDEALANAFKALKKSSGSGSRVKKSKAYRVEKTTVMHFRIRVLDLIEIYLQQNPSLLISIEIMLALYDMLEYCVGDEFKQLQTKTEKVLTKLTKLKIFISRDDVKEDDFVNFIRLIVEKKTSAVVRHIVDKMRNKCTCFLISNANKIHTDINNNKILNLFLEYIHEFIKSRNPVINISLLSNIFGLSWPNVWKISEELTRQGLTLQTLTFRRIQILEVLSVVYKNIRLQMQNTDAAKEHLKKIEKCLSSYIKLLSEKNSAKYSTKEFETLLDLILTAEKVYQRMQLQNVLTSESSLISLQNIRKRIHLESIEIYQRFCQKFKQQVIANSDVENNEQEIDSKSDYEYNNEIKDSKPEPILQKRKLSGEKWRKLKMHKKQKRQEATSLGLNGGIEFTQRN